MFIADSTMEEYGKWREEDAKEDFEQNSNDIGHFRMKFKVKERRSKTNAPNHIARKKRQN